MSKKSKYLKKALPLASMEFEEEVQKIFLSPKLSPEQFASQFLFLIGEKWSLMPYLRYRFRNKELDDFTEQVRFIAGSYESVLEVRKKYLSSEEYDRMLQADSSDQAESDEDEDEYLVDLTEFSNLYFQGQDIPEELVWLVEFQNRYHGYVGNGINIGSHDDLSEYGVQDCSRLFPFATEADGALIAVWKSDRDRFPVVFLDMECPEDSFIIANDMKEFLHVLTLPLCHISELNRVGTIEYEGVDKELKLYRKKAKRKYNVQKPTNVQSRNRELQREYLGFGDWFDGNVIPK